MLIRVSMNAGRPAYSAPAGLCGQTVRMMSRVQKVTAEMLAEKLELSRTTVSLVLNGRAEACRIAKSTQKRILAAARKMRYQPNAAARQLAGKNSNVIGVLVTSEMMIDLRLIEVMEILAAERGMRFIVGHAVGSPDRVIDYLNDFRSRGVDGLFSFFHHHPAHRHVLAAELKRFANVVFYEQPGDRSAVCSPRCCYAGPDFFEVGRVGVQHLVDRGRRRIALVLREMAFPYAVARREAYHRVLGDSDDLVWVMAERTGRPWTSPFTPEIAMQAVDDLVAEKRADGIVAVNDFYAACLVRALRKRGFRVPDDVAVVGCDNLEIGAVVEPSITTVDLKLGDVARSLMSLMFQRLDGKRIREEHRGILVKPELFVRESS